MNVPSEAEYRLRLAEGFLAEARQDVSLSRWRAAVDNSQLCVENAAKALLARLGPVGRTHNPAAMLRQILEEGRFPSNHRQSVEAVVERAELLGPDIHIQTDYGDESAGLTPWELFSEEDARRALQIAEEVYALVDQLLHNNGQ